MAKAESNIAPDKYKIERYDNKADIVLTENVVLADKNGEASYTYDIYRITVLDRTGLEQSISNAMSDWINAAKMQNDQSSVPSLPDRVQAVEQASEKQAVTLDDIVTVLEGIV